MGSEGFQRALILTGPTGSGKSVLGEALAVRLGAEIVSMDSMAVYRGMDIGTAKPVAPAVPYHLVDVLEPWESASVAWWLERAEACCRDIESRGRKVLIVGGTALYLKAMLRGLFHGPPADVGLRAELADTAHRDGPAALHARLAAVDPASAARLHVNDVRRVVRALEVWHLTGQPMSAWQTQWRVPKSVDTPRVHWLDLPRDELYARIDARVLGMMRDGLLEEVAALRGLEKPLSREAAQALGYKELLAHLDGHSSLEESVRLIQTRSRQFAKRQLTWFRSLPEAQPVSAEEVHRLSESEA